MAERIPESNVEIEGHLFGANSIVSLSIKTAVWLLTAIFGLVMGILTYSYFELKGDVNNKHNEFVKSVDEKVIKVQNDVTNIRLGQEEMKGDIKLILDRQIREPIKRSANSYVPSNIPPKVPNVVDIAAIALIPIDTILN